MISRVIGFDKQDHRHLRWLAKSTIKDVITGNWSGVKEGLILIKLHISRDSEKGAK